MLECTFYDIISDCVGLFKFYFFFFLIAITSKTYSKLEKLSNSF